MSNRNKQAVISHSNIMSNPNRDRGHNFERDIVHTLKEMGYDAVTSRQESRSADAAGIDIITNFPLKIQCKAMVNTPPVYDILTTTEAEVIFWRRMRKRGKRFYSDGEYAIIDLNKFLNLLKL